MESLLRGLPVGSRYCDLPLIHPYNGKKVKIKLKLFANLRQYLPGAFIGEGVEIEVPEKNTLADFAAELKLPPDAVKVCFVNGIICELDQHLKEGNAVGIFQATGGR